MADGKKNILLRAVTALSLPEETVPGVTRLTVVGRDRVLIENQRGLLDYGTEEIAVNGGRVIIKLTGNGLELAAMTDAEVEVTGKISRIEFLE